MIIDELITDRMESDVVRLKELIKKTWQGMTAEEREEYDDGIFPLEDINGIWLQDSTDEQLYSQASVQRGAYNYTDWNRVETAVGYVSGELVQADTDLRAYATSLGVAWSAAFALPYDPSSYSLTTKTDWNDESKPSTTQMARYLNNVVLIKAAIPNASAAWLPDSMDRLDYSGANGIEQVLIDIHTALALLIAERMGLIRSALAVNYSGEIYSGEGEA